MKKFDEKGKIEIKGATYRVNSTQAGKAYMEKTVRTGIYFDQVRSRLLERSIRTAKGHNWGYVVLDGEEVSLENAHR